MPLSRRTTIVVAVLTVLALTVVPWHSPAHTTATPEGLEAYMGKSTFNPDTSLGYAFILSAPADGVIDFGRVLLELGVIGTLAGASVLIRRRT